MSKSQKILAAFAVLELIIAVFGVGNAIQTGGISPWLGVLLALLTAYLLYAAAKDASRIMGAWILLLVNLILNSLNLLLAAAGLGAAASAGLDSSVVKAGTGMVILSILVLALTIVAFLAANDVKKQGK